MPPIKSIMRSLEFRRQGPVMASPADSRPPAEYERRSYLVWLAGYLDLDLLALGETARSGKSVALTIASRLGSATEFVVPSLDQKGLISRLVEANQPGRGRGRLFSTDEVLPRDGNWCDFVPMDSVVSYCFFPVNAVPLPDSLMGQRPHSAKQTFVVAADVGGTEPDLLLEIRTRLAAVMLDLCAAALAFKRMTEIRRTTEAFLEREGYGLAVADRDGELTRTVGRPFVEMDGAAREALKSRIRAAMPRLSDGSGGRVDATPDCLKASEIPAELTGEYLTDGGLVIFCRRPRQPQDAETRREGINLLCRLASSIAHEIKNPLTGIAAGIQYLAKKLKDSAAETDTVDFILSEIARLDRIIDDLYKMAKPPQLALQKVLLNDIVGRSLICLGEEIVRKRLSIQQHLAPDIPAFDADPDRLQQVLINLLKNAVEASPPSSTIGIATSYGPDKVRVSIRDHGPGISAEDAHRVFEPFYSTKKGGAGLGLSVSQAIVEEHGGTIVVRTPDDGGAEFIVELPSRC